MSGALSQLLILAIVYMSLCQSEVRRNAAMIFSAITLIHYTLSPWLDGHIFFASAALMDLCIMILTANLIVMPKLVTRLHHICCVSIVLNCTGWIAWMLRWDLAIYALSYVFLYMWVIIILMKDEGVDNERNIRLGWWANRFRVHSHTGCHNN